MKKSKETLKKYFETGDRPTQEQYEDLIDSYIDAKQPEGEANRRFVIDEKGEVYLASQERLPAYTLSEITGNKLSLLKDGEVVKEIDLSIYLDDTNLARLVSGTVDEKGMATFKRDDGSTFTVDFSAITGESQTDWSQTDDKAPDFLKNKPTKISDFINDGEDGVNKFITKEDTTKLQQGSNITIATVGENIYNIDVDDVFEKYENKVDSESDLDSDTYFSTLGTKNFIDSLKDQVNGLAMINAQGKINNSVLPDLAISTIVLVKEKSMMSFLFRANDYQFQTGDSIQIITDDGFSEIYLFKGGNKSTYQNYARIVNTKVSLSQVVGLQSELDNKAKKTEIPTQTSQLINDGEGSGKFITASDIPEATIPGLPQVLNVNNIVENGVITLASGSTAANYTHNQMTISHNSSELKTFINSAMISSANSNTETTLKADGVYFGSPKDVYNVILKAPTGLSSNFVSNLQAKDGTVALLEDITNYYKIIDSETPLVSSDLNALYPDTAIGTKVINKNMKDSCFYIKIDTNVWRKSGYLQDIDNPPL